jgi:iron complex outermembrane receptor protein
LFAAAVVFVAAAAQVAAQSATLADLSLEELGAIRVTTVSRTPERIADAPASVFVITSDDIRRSGATSLPEALRLAPNLAVARADSVQYAISARGFNNAVGNKLLVMIDGRTVYTPLFSGVFWDQQDVLLADVDRIEVISGPGATLWGANAVNGVINVITKPAGDTQGALVSARAGDLERQAAVRYGGPLGTSGAFRAYVQTTALDRTHLASGAGGLDEWQRAQAGFRADWQRDDDRLTLQTDAYSGRSQDRGTILNIPLGRIEVSGANILARWTRELGGGRELQVQSYLDRASRDDFLFFRPTADIFDIELQHTIPLGRHDLIWGGDYRRSSDDIRTGFATTFIPQKRELDWESLFLQDRWAITTQLEATLGLKLESNDYTGTESLPSFRIAWKPTSGQLVWGSLSRAVRAPSRYDRDVFFPGQPPFLVIGGPNFKSEVAKVLEAGYRAQPNDKISFSVTAFYHDWDRLRSGTALPVQLENRIEGDADGVEAWATWRIAHAWQIAAGFNTLDKDLQLEPGSTDPVGVNNETLANDADYQWLLRASADLAHDLELDVRVRHVDALPNPAVPAYTAVDATVGWRPRPRLDLRLIAQNLFDAAHPEYGPAPTRSELERGVLLQATLDFGR